MAYATVDEVLTRMGHDGSTDPVLRANITAALDAASATIDGDTGRSFSQEVGGVKVFGAPSPSTASLRVPDLVSVSALKVDDTDDGSFETTIASSGFELDTLHTSSGWPFDQVRLLDRGWPSGGRRRRRIEITGTWGWAAVPAAVRDACILLTVRVAQRAHLAAFGVQEIGELGGAFIRAKDPDYHHLLGRYTRVAVA